MGSHREQMLPLSIYILYICMCAYENKHAQKSLNLMHFANFSPCNGEPLNLRAKFIHIIYWVKLFRWRARILRKRDKLIIFFFRFVFVCRCCCCCCRCCFPLARRPRKKGSCGKMYKKSCFPLFLNLISSSRENFEIIPRLSVFFLKICNQEVI